MKWYIVANEKEFSLVYTYYFSYVIVITGASANNWPSISKEDQHEIAVMMQVLANTLDPEKAFIVTGGTNFGVEKKCLKQ